MYDVCLFAYMIICMYTSCMYVCKIACMDGWMDGWTHVCMYVV